MYRCIVIFFGQYIDTFKFCIVPSLLQQYSPCKKELLLVSKSFAVSVSPAAIFSYYVIKTILSDEESREE